MHEVQTNAEVLGSALKQQSMRHCVLPFLLAAKKLTGLSSGDSIDFEDIFRLAVGNNMCRALTIIMQIELHVIMHEMDEAMNLLRKYSSVRNDIPGFFTGARLTVIEGLINLKAAQASTSNQERRKNEKKAKKAIKLIRNWLKSGNVNLVHALHFLSAEHAALKRRKTLAEKEFKLAISVATKSGFVQDKGLTHELAGRYFIEQDDAYWAEYHLDQAIEAFSEWDALTKVKQLREQKAELMERFEAKV